ncbi:MAG: Asp23/Gls24 family envelope stress response protein [Ruminococcaceae bacterium]|nr:Asp23/Gls24 family envelope stress response protein [Oscillospiraceae bacterium]
MSNINKSRNSGSLVISEDVIASIAVNASKDVEGVSGFAQRPINLHSFYKIADSASKYVDVTMSDTDVKIHIYVKVSQDAKIQTLAEKVQQNIKNAVQNMTGMMVSEVDVTISTADIENAPTQS